MGNILEKYIEEAKATGRLNSKMAAYVAMLDTVYESNPEAVKSIVKELKAQRSRLKLVASENYSSLPVQMSMGNLLTDKYAEGYPKHRYYAGCENVDAVEQDAINAAKALFNAEHAYVQPHSGADANLIAYWAVLDAKVLKPSFENLKSEVSRNVKTYDDLALFEWEYLRNKAHKQRLLSLDYSSGSHLTHGYRQNISAQMFECHHYSVGKNGLLDYQAIRQQAMDVRPLILLAGYSAYPRKINFRKMREIADACGAVLMVDMAHFAGLVAGKVFEGDYDPVKWADIVTTTTHKTLRGPRGGLILCREWLKDSVDKGCPLVMGGPLPHVMAAKATALKEALKPEFAEYARQVVKNANALAKALSDRNVAVHTGGTENHIVMIDVSKRFNLTGRQAEDALFKCGIVANRNTLPNDPNGPWYTSGVRLGTAALTTLGMDEIDMKTVADIIFNVLENTWAIPGSKSKYETAGEEREIALARVDDLLKKHVLYPELDFEFLEKAFV